MSDNRRSEQFESEQLPEFLEHIARMEAEEIEKLRKEYRDAARQVRTEARRRSRKYHRRVCEEIRARLESDRARRLARTQSELRRRRWEMLRELEQTARGKIREELRSRWNDSSRQASWCRYWLRQCRHLDAGSETRILLGRDVHSATLQMVRDWIGESGRTAEVEVDESLGEGIVIHQGELTIDGLLETQVEPLLEKVHHDIAGWLHEGDIEEGGEEQ